MLNTRLILLEGPPGSGKTTTAGKLADDVNRSGAACQCFFEWSSDHPIPIGDDLHLDRVIQSSIAREGEMLEMWQRFAQARQADTTITVMESRFWQTSVMLMYIAGHPVDGVLASNRRVVEIIQPLNPVLIYFTIDNLRGFVEHTIQIKETEWQRGGLPGTWAGHVFAAFEGQPWLAERGLSGQGGFVTLLEEWMDVSEQLYAQLPFPKLKINNPQQNWAASMRQMRDFLELPG
jgi:hypothetical protein